MADKLGYYLVGWKKFYNKTLALIESKKTGYEIKWIFNDEVYKKIDWTVPIETPLMDLYKKRALQLREKYDYLILYYSGGADSTNVLHAFIDNNIFLDEILMWNCEPTEKTFNNIDYSNKNYNSEIKYAALEHINKFKNNINPKTKITIKDFAKPGVEILKKHDNWYENMPLGVTLGVAGVLRQLTQQQDAYFLKQKENDKLICYIMGIDKPLVWNDGTDYYAYFQDTGAYHVMNPVDFNKIHNDKVTTEFFYWTPDFPEIVVKQAQLIKSQYETNTLIRHMAKKSLNTHISEYRSIIHNAIYPEYTCEKFQTEKPSTHLKRPMDQWFWETADINTQKNFLETIQYLEKNTNPNHMIKNDIQWGISAHRSIFYKL